MPKRNDIKRILLIGSGPIVIGQACEFDYSGTQALKALREEGYELCLINSNPATIMTDPEFADRTYIEPITADFIEEIIRIERPDALLPTMGGQTALNATLELAERGVLNRYKVELIGASVDAIKLAEDREKFREAMAEIGLESARSGLARSVEEAQMLSEIIGFPLVLRPSRTLGGTGGGIVYNESELKQKVSKALNLSPNREVLIEESLLGWKEIELEVMRDLKDNVVIICGIENFDPMGVHTGDSITVAPIQTLTDKEYQILRDGAIRVMRRIGVETGGSNVQFAINPKDGRVIIIEMNPRVSRSSALASKATGFPIAKIAAKLAVGYSLDEIANDITRETPACFEPSIDYVVVKIPRFNFEKFPFSDPTLGTQMKSVGEVMAFGRNFQQALQKAICSMELGSCGFDGNKRFVGLGRNEVLEACRTPTPERLWAIGEALRAGHSSGAVSEVSQVDPWFVEQIRQIVDTENQLKASKFDQISFRDLRALKSKGFSDRRLEQLSGRPEAEWRKERMENGVLASFRTVDTCAAEFVAHTPYLYSSFEDQAEQSGHTEQAPSKKRKVIILGSGPNRIGQGIEFDYCCVHAVLGLKQDGYETVMVNCNPETVSTDYDISDRLYFEPLTLESVLAIVQREQPLAGLIVQFGGQTPLKLSGDLAKLEVPILGTSVDSIDVAEDRGRFSALVAKLGLQQPEFATARTEGEALEAAERIGYPLMLRPSFVLGGRAMRVVYSEEDLRAFFRETIEVSEQRGVLLDRFLNNALEVDVDAVSDGQEVLIAGVMEHIERAGIHSGDSSCCIPPQSLNAGTVSELKRQARMLAHELKVVGLMNVQFAVTRDGQVYILEVNPRASRTVPFVSKVSGVPWAQIAARVMAGKSLKQLGVRETEVVDKVAVKACVFPFAKFEGVDTVLGPEMKSTGEVMGIDRNFAISFAKSQRAAQVNLPSSGKVFLSIADEDKEELPELARALSDLGYQLVATSGTAKLISDLGLPVERVFKVREGSPHVVDLLGTGAISLVVNTPEGGAGYSAKSMLDSRSIRLVANAMGIPTYTTIAAAKAVAQSLRAIRDGSILRVAPLQGN